MRLKYLSIFILIFYLLSCANDGIVMLKVEYESTPLGIDVEKPRFSWQMNSDKKGQFQTAFQIIVRDEYDNEVWDTGKIYDNSSLNIEYDGMSLMPTTKYLWSVVVWDKDENELKANSWFETGLMESTLSAWSDAKWIGGNDDDLVLHPNYLPTYNINYTLQLDKESGSTKAGFVFGANDPRLMNSNMNIYNIGNDRDESYIEVELDVLDIDKNKNASIKIYRVGYSPTDKMDIPLQVLEIPVSVINKDNAYDKHTIYLNTMYGTTDIFIGSNDESNKVGSVTINPIGQGWDYICFPLLCEIGFSLKPDQIATFYDVQIRNYRTPNNILFSEDKINSTESIFYGNNNIVIDNNSYKVIGTSSNTTFISANIERNSMPMLRTTFSSAESNVSKARLYITSRGIYEVYMNGEKIGDDYFNPGLTQYNKHHMYQTYDVTDFIQKGDNAIGVMMGEGWWSGAITYMGYLWNLFGDRQSLLAKLVITYDDGSEKIISTDPDTWKYFDSGPVVYSSFFQGEVYDARKEILIEDWTSVYYDDSEWERAVESNQESAIIEDKIIKQGGMPSVNDFSNLKLIGQYGQTIKKVKELTAISMEEVRPGVYVYDMGQNMVGLPHITLNNEEPGTEIKLRYAEVKYPDLPEFEQNKDMIMLENIRGALAQDIYIARGGKETINPHFTFHGYRYIEITGIKNPLPLKSVKGDVLSSIDELASGYETSNKKINKLWENITWSFKGNFLSIPTDCPQRNERMGWSGDISVFSRTATYLAELPQFLRRHMLAMRDTQREDGRFADVAPIGGGFGGILWGSAGITVAWESYMQYNDIRMLEEHYDSMKSYINYLLGYIDPDTGILIEGNLGDWLGPEQHKNDNSLLWESYFIYDLDLMHKIATKLHNNEDAEWFNRLYKERKQFFNNTYFDQNTGQTIHSGFGNINKKDDIIGTQTSYVLPLAFDICTPEIRQKVINNLLDLIKNETKQDNGDAYAPYSLMTGFIGTAWLNKVLSDTDNSEVAYKILQQENYPSWLYSVNQGATTIWERLNSYTAEKGFGGNNSMNSFNHYSFGAIGSWMYNYSLGIERDDDYPGFQNFILQPNPDSSNGINWAKGFYNSMYGPIESEWSVDKEGCNYRFVIPANTSAKVLLKTSDISLITESNKPIDASPYIKIIGEESDKVVILLQSGEYKFRIDR